MRLFGHRVAYEACRSCPSRTGVRANRAAVGGSRSGLVRSFSGSCSSSPEPTALPDAAGCPPQSLHEHRPHASLPRPLIDDLQTGRLGAEGTQRDDRVELYFDELDDPVGLAGISGYHPMEEAQRRIDDHLGIGRERAMSPPLARLGAGARSGPASLGRGWCSSRPGPSRNP